MTLAVPLGNKLRAAVAINIEDFAVFGFTHAA
jgi:hypothetical protein